MKGHFTLILLSIVTVARGQEVQATPVEAQTALVMNGRELTASNIAQGRDLKLYDDGGHFDCRQLALSDTAPRNCDLPKARDFIWEHWQKKRRGYIRVTVDSVDTMSTSHIFIEPDSHGAWHVAWRIAQTRANGPSVVMDLSGFTTVERTGSKLAFKATGGSETQL
jgi:hypothetical protein